jgi:hypothetical protein
MNGDDTEECDADDNNNDEDGDDHEGEEPPSIVHTASEEECDRIAVEISDSMSFGVESLLDNPQLVLVDDPDDDGGRASAEIVGRPVLKLAIPAAIPEEEPPASPPPPERMSDGEAIRECRPGFQDLKNCKRFWQAQQLIGTRKDGEGKEEVGGNGRLRRKSSLAQFRTASQAFSSSKLGQRRSLLWSPSSSWSN